jgi:hypothetical protein
LQLSICSNYGNETSSAVFASLIEQSLIHQQAIVLSDPAKLAAPSRSLHFTHPTASAAIQYPIERKPAGLGRDALSVQLPKN